MGKKKLLVIFNDVGAPFLRLVSYENDNYVKHVVIPLAEHEVENDELVNLERISKAIRDFDKDVKDVYLIVNSKHTFKNTLTFPKMSHGKSEKLYKREMKTLSDRTKETYVTRVVTHTYALGVIYYTYFVPSRLIHSFKKLCKLMNIRLVGFDLYALQIANYITSDPKIDTIYFIEDGTLGTFFYILNGVVCSSVSLSISESVKMNAALYSYLSRHEYELEKKEIKRLISYSSYVYFSDLQNAIEVKYEQKKIDPRLKFKGVLL